MLYGKISDDVYPLRKPLFQVHLQKVALDQPVRELGVVLMQIGHTFPIHLRSVERNILPLQKKLRQHSRSAPHLEYRTTTICLQTIGNSCEPQTDRSKNAVPNVFSA